MARLNVKPTRMELSNLKKRLAVSERGHKLLKDKQDELMRQFIGMVRTANTLRDETENALKHVQEKTVLAKSVFPEKVMKNTYFLDKPSATVDISMINLMGLQVPEMTFHGEASQQSGFLASNYALTEASNEMVDLLPKLLELAEIEKKCVLLASEIEKVRRRVNALEHLTIPQLIETIRYIQMKLEDGERESVTRLLKIKDMDEKASQEAARKKAGKQA